MPPTLSDLEASYRAGVDRQRGEERWSPMWGRGLNELTAALHAARELTGDPTFCFEVEQRGRERSRWDKDAPATASAGATRREASGGVGRQEVEDV